MKVILKKCFSMNHKITVSDAADGESFPIESFVEDVFGFPTITRNEETLSTSQRRSPSPSPETQEAGSNNQEMVSMNQIKSVSIGYPCMPFIMFSSIPCTTSS